jgi:mannitol 2-dehydrogenase
MTVLNKHSLAELDARISVPGYDRDHVSVGIVHLGPGAFHRAHEAMYVDSYLSTGDRSWGICTVGLLPGDSVIRDVLADQDGLYSLFTVRPDGAEEARVIGSLVKHLHAPDDPAAVLEMLSHPATRIVSLTITEGGYGVDDATGTFTPPDAGTRADLSGSGLPVSAFGFIVAALAMRRATGTRPFTVMSCDNIQGNGHVAEAAITGFAAQRDPDLAAWISANVAFPSSMVDRITPATTGTTRETARLWGIDDRWPVRAESFAQWVVEDRFSAGRPALERVGVQFVEDVSPYEKLKLRLLNASHQALSYLGLLNGFEYVHEACRDPLFVRFLRGYMTQEAIPTLDPVAGMSVDAYCDQLIERFAGDAVQDTLARLAVDGSDRISKFMVPVLSEQLSAGRGIGHCSLVLAAWSCFLAGETNIDPVDKRLPDLREAIAAEHLAPGSFLDYRPVFGDLGSDPTLRQCFVEARDALRELGARGAITQLLGVTAGDGQAG